MQNINMHSMFDFVDLNSIELLGYSKNNIIEAGQKAKKLSEEHQIMLHQAYMLIDSVQQYLYEH